MLSRKQKKKRLVFLYSVKSNKNTEMLQATYLYLRSSGAYFDLALKTTWDKIVHYANYCTALENMFSLPHS